MYPNSFKSIVLLYEKGKETSHVAEMFNCSKSSIYAWKKDRSIQRMQKKKNIILNVEGRSLDRFLKGLIFISPINLYWFAAI